MAIKNSVSNDFLSMFVDSINVFHCHLSSVFKVIPYRYLHIRAIDVLLSRFYGPKGVGRITTVCLCVCLSVCLVSQVIPGNCHTC